MYAVHNEPTVTAVGFEVAVGFFIPANDFTFFYDVYRYQLKESNFFF